jgi:hypothetical protein
MSSDNSAKEHDGLTVVLRDLLDLSKAAGICGGRHGESAETGLSADGGPLVYK